MEQDHNGLIKKEKILNLDLKLIKQELLVGSVCSLFTKSSLKESDFMMQIKNRSSNEFGAIVALESGQSGKRFQKDNRLLE